MYSADNTEGSANRLSVYAFNNRGGLGAESYFQGDLRAGEWIYSVAVFSMRMTSNLFPQGFVSIYRYGVRRSSNSFAAYDISPVSRNAPLRIGTRDFGSYLWALSVGLQCTLMSSMMPRSGSTTKQVAQPPPVQADRQSCTA